MGVGQGTADAPWRLREKGTLKAVLALCLLVPELTLELNRVPAVLAAPVLATAPARPASTIPHSVLFPTFPRMAGHSKRIHAAKCIPFMILFHEYNCVFYWNEA